MRALEITTHLPCKVNCWYCPQDKLIKAYKSFDKYLSLWNFKKCIDRVDCDIHFTGFSEPMQHPMIMEMIDYALKEHEVAISTTLVGASREQVKKLNEFDFKSFTIHITEKTPIELVKLSRGRRVYLDKKPDIKAKKAIMHTRAGNTDKVAHKGKLKRCRGFQPVMLPNCDVYMCCMDYSLTCKVGNLLESAELSRGINAELCKMCHYETD